MITNELKKFANGNTDFYVAFDEYYAWFLMVILLKSKD